MRTLGDIAQNSGIFKFAINEMNIIAVKCQNGFNTNCYLVV